MSKLLTIITPVIRLAGALETARSVQQAREHELEVRHLLAYWPGEAVSEQRLLAPWLTQLIASVARGWLLGLDDDNRLHPDLPRRLSELIDTYPAARAFVFDCAYPGRAHDLCEARAPRPGSIDGGQVVLHTDLAQSIPWPMRECGDGHYLSALYAAHQDVFVFVPEVLTYHNHQVWADGQAA